MPGSFGLDSYSSFLFLLWANLIFRKELLREKPSLLSKGQTSSRDSPAISHPFQRGPTNLWLSWIVLFLQVVVLHLFPDGARLQREFHDHEPGDVAQVGAIKVRVRADHSVQVRPAQVGLEEISEAQIRSTEHR